MDIDEIKKILPHRYPFLFLDRVTAMTENSIEGIKNVTGNESFFAGHFPDYPLMPGVLIIEAIAQAGAVLILKKLPGADGKSAVFMGIDKARFRRPVRPGDTLRVTAEIIHFKPAVTKFKGAAYVDGKLVCEAEFLAGLTPKRD
jgi:3-hydroxyacyl-[acyl-carrier-protein] dehydratase